MSSMCYRNRNYSSSVIVTDHAQDKDSQGYGEKIFQKQYKNAFPEPYSLQWF